MADVLGGFNVNGPTAGFANTIQTLILRNVIEKLRTGLHFTPAGSTAVATQRPGGNGTYRFTNWTDIEPDLSASNEVTPPSPTFMFGDDLEFTAKLIDAYIPVTWLASIQAGENLMARSVETISRMAAEAYDTLVRDVYQAATTDLYGGTGNAATADVAAGDVLDADLCMTILTTLRSRDVQPLPDGTYHVVGHPAAFDPLLRAMALGTVSAANFGTVGNLPAGAIGKFLQLSFHDTTRGIVSAGGGTGAIDVHKLAVLGRQSTAVSAVNGNFQPIVRLSNGIDDPTGKTLGTVGYRAYAGAAIVKVANRSDGAGVSAGDVQRSLTVEVAAA